MGVDCGHRDGCGCGCGCGRCVRDEAIVPDPLVDGIDPECCGGSGFEVLFGYMGPGDAEGMWRLYRDLRMDDHYLLRDDDIVAQRQHDGGSFVWICRDRLIRRVRLASAGRLEEEFLHGRITRNTPAGGGPRPDGLPGEEWDGPASVRPSKCNC